MRDINITAEEAAKWLDYDPATGEFRWRLSAGKAIKSGSPAGTVNARGYRYISVLGVEMPAQRWAWLIVTGEKPNGRLKLKDGNPGNLRFDNLVLNRGIKGYDSRTKEGRAQYQLTYRSSRRAEMSAKEIERKFGLDLATYSAMVAEQDNKCAICKCAETATRNGKVKALAVDHNHETGAVRGLLCFECNTAIGKIHESRDRLLSAVRYLDKHNSDASNVVELRKEKN